MNSRKREQQQFSPTGAIASVHGKSSGLRNQNTEFSQVRIDGYTRTAMMRQSEVTRVCCGMDQNAAGERGKVAPGTRERIERTIRYMTEHLNQPLQAPDLAALANMSLSHYFALFKGATGCAPIEFFIRLRMSRARLLLETTSLNIKEISSGLGYEDPFYFSRLFKLSSGVAPSDYRKVHQGVIQFSTGRARSDSSQKPVWENGRHEKIVVTKGASSSPRARSFLMSSDCPQPFCENIE
jgi:AraC-like DNA-binding protein